MRELLTEEEFTAFHEALSASSSPTSIRLNLAKLSQEEAARLQSAGTPVPWCREGIYLRERPLFTTDPLLHAGTYYVQEASSMFLSHVLRCHAGDTPLQCLDLCAAPGGKTTAALSALPAGSSMACNEIDRKRARILAENIQKWGSPDVIVTSNTPADFGRLRHTFDIILTDVPCSGEGMFRKDPKAIEDWSPAKVRDCAALQQKILESVWPALKPGGLLVYSTCTFNTQENEQMFKYICEGLGAEALAVPVEAEWHIHPPLAGALPCYRFMPHCTQGEGLFMAVCRKHNDENCRPARPLPDKKKKTHRHATAKASPAMDSKKAAATAAIWLDESDGFRFETTEEGILRAIPAHMADLHRLLSSHSFYLLQSGIEVAAIKGKDLIPAQGLALSTALSDTAFVNMEIAVDTALHYLRRESIDLPPETPNGYVLVRHRGHPLGFVKNIGTRSNNLYPQEWRIRHL